MLHKKLYPPYENCFQFIIPNTSEWIISNEESGSLKQKIEQSSSTKETETGIQSEWEYKKWKSKDPVKGARHRERVWESERLNFREGWRGWKWTIGTKGSC